MRIVFCSEAFPSARLMLQERLPGDDCQVWRDRNTPCQVSDVDVLIPMMFPIDASVMDHIRPRLIQQWGSGLEGVDLGAARARRIPVAGVPSSGSNAESVAEHALLLILSLLRQLPAAQANVRAGVLGAPLGRMLAGRTICLWGLGATAFSLARRLRALDARLFGITRNPAAQKVAGFRLDACFRTEQASECLGEAEILVLCVRLCNETRGLVNADVLSKLREGAYLVNVARGALLDYAALRHALRTGRLGGAALDVFWNEPIAGDDPLLGLPNVIATPHVAGVTEQSYSEIADAVVANIERVRHGEALMNQVV
jgi:phosphoglycerate dehydrogenase-like enzyme